MKSVCLLLYLFLTTSLFAGEIADTGRQEIPIKFIYEGITFPESWLAAPISGQGESLDRSEQARSRSIIEKALSKYPVIVLKQNLRQVYVLKTMSFYGVGYGGTNSNEEVFLTNNGLLMGYSDSYIEQTFHHEFSSILFRNFPHWFEKDNWSSLNPHDFDYKDPENGVGAIRNNESSQDIDTGLCRMGFLTQYALSGLENDLNTIAQNLFLPSPGFWMTVDHFPLIAAKTRILISFYNKLHPSFTEEFFRKQ